MDMNYDEKGLVPVITQDFETKEVLMLAYANREALEKTLETGKVHYYSRRRQSLWMKGETSGHFQFVKQILVDCDQDTLLILVSQTGAACHTGNYSCFYRSYDGEEIIDKKINKEILKVIYDVILDRQINPKAGSYTNYLLSKGIDKMLKKVGEESAEVIIAAKNREKSEIIYETADLLYHLSVVLVENKITWDEIFDELTKRR